MSGHVFSCASHPISSLLMMLSRLLGKDGAFGVAAMDGRVAVCRIQPPPPISSPPSEESHGPHWSNIVSMNTSRPLFSVSSFVLRRRPKENKYDGEDPSDWTGGVAACAWSGMTWLLEGGCQTLSFDPSKRVVPPLRAFSAGISTCA